MTGRPKLRSLCGKCGHEYEAHTHFRAGTDCSLCACKRYVRGDLLPPARAGVDQVRIVAGQLSFDEFLAEALGER